MKDRLSGEEDTRKQTADVCEVAVDSYQKEAYVSNMYFYLNLEICLD